MEHSYKIYMEYIWDIRNIQGISINIYDQKHRRRLRRRPNGAAAFGGRPIGSVFLIINLYGYALYIPYIFLIYIYIFHIYFLDMFYIVSFVCFLIYGGKSRSGHDRSQSFGPIWLVSGPENDYFDKIYT